ncbi:unnamed protein product [Peniophora sp. CBMAI 1063]|nr:unnamed protein product [Peniophora sp. CBMAI 1063]
MSTESNAEASGSTLRHYRERALSSASLASSGDVDDLPDASSASARPKLTRKRFSESQVARMEELYNLTTHPSRARREQLARNIDMEAKQVTVWFQNRRQADRKVERNEFFEAIPLPDADERPDGPRRRVTLRPLHAHMSSTASTSALSLDAIATREERRTAYPASSNMNEGDVPPVARPGTLEWACAQERVAHRLGERPPVYARPRRVNFTATTSHRDAMNGVEGVDPEEQQPAHTHTHTVAQDTVQADPGDQDGAGDTDVGEETEDEAHEAITPAGSLLADAFKAAGVYTGKGNGEKPMRKDDDELMSAAVVLASLGRHT